MSGQLSEELCKADRQHHFETVAQSFRVIDKETLTVAASPELVAKMKAEEKFSAQELQRGSFNLRRRVITRLGLSESELPMLSECG